MEDTADYYQMKDESRLAPTMQTFGKTVQNTIQDRDPRPSECLLKYELF